MAVDFAQGSLAMSTAAVGTTMTVSGLSFFPEVILFQVNGRTESVDTISDQSIRESFGFSMKTGAIIKRGVIAYYSQHNVTTTNTNSGQRGDAVVATIQSDDTFEGLADIDDHTTDGFRLIIDEQFTYAHRVHWWAFGGTDITALNIVEVSQPATAQEVTVEPGFTPDLLVCLGSGTNTPPAVTPGGRFSIGYAARRAAEINVEQGVIAMGSENGVTTSDVGKHNRAGRIWALPDAGLDGMSSRAEVSGWVPTGFKVNFVESDGNTALKLYFLCVKGGSWSVKNFTTLSNDTASTFDVVGAEFNPKGAMYMGVGDGQSGTDSLDNFVGGVSTGFMAGAGSQSNSGCKERHGLTTTITTTWVEYDTVFAQVFEGLHKAKVAVTALITDGIRHQMPLSEASTHFVQVLMGGDGTGVNDDFQPVSRRHYGIHPNRNGLGIGI